MNSMDHNIPSPPYQSNNLRALLLTAGVIMLLATPFQPYIIFLSAKIPTYAAAIICVVCAGVINRKIPYFFIITGIITLLLLVSFQSLAVDYFAKDASLFVMLDEFVALLLFFSAYYSFRSHRELKHYFQNNISGKEDKIVKRQNER